ncbi:kinase-like domain-containing protein [Pseudomassariella vexata]|uniref:Kinase-like domain-containing protein n=1 Tax=Pseudomassariella vexata TaxID=1141098 RepID=A0A1Y2EDC4_9PEZI|nr:kinase-like domain-containing protein [Pseudomassariella vexata]ORY69579.1 kinase-like domain-containing protein [Pseudomassariella vexata]
MNVLSEPVLQSKIYHTIHPNLQLSNNLRLRSCSPSQLPRNHSFLIKASSVNPFASGYSSDHCLMTDLGVGPIDKHISINCPNMEQVPLAQIVCRVVDTELAGLQPAGGGFLIPGPHDDGLNQALLPSCSYDLRARCSLTVGRDTDPQVNSICVDNVYVSRTHFEIYSVVYEEYDLSKQQPMIYIRDRQSLSGTSVNGCIIGCKASGPSPGHLLSHGDVVRINPYWEFEIRLPQCPRWSCPLRGIQSHEARTFCDRYLITDRVLGIGNHCTIHLAIDVKSGRQLACKISDLDRARKSTAAIDIIRAIGWEADILGKVRHPNLLTLEYAFRSKHTLYIFTELATGGDLFSMYQTHDGFFSENQTKFVMYQVVRAVAYLHKQGLSHRDLKPENIFFASGPDVRNRVIVGDLGGAMGTTWGRMKSNVGTEMYLAPEMHFGHLSYTETVDIWSIGMITLVLMTANQRHQLSHLKAMNQESIDETLKAILKPLYPTASTLSEDGQDFIRRCLKVNAGQRMTASQAKEHSWFHLPKLTKDEWNKVRNESWKPSHRTAPPVEDLPNLEIMVAYPHLELVNKKSAFSLTAFTTSSRNRKLDENREKSGDGASPYFSPRATSKTTKILKKGAGSKRNKSAQPLRQ